MRPARLALVGAAVLATALALTAPTPATAAVSAGRDVSLRVASYNIHHGAGTDGAFDLARTAEAIRATGADVIGLQEVDKHWGSRSEWRDETAELAEMLGMRVSYFADIYDLDPPSPGRPDREYGLAILSRYPIIHAENHKITRLSTQTPGSEPAPAPGFPEVVVSVHGVRVHVYDTHLDYRADPSVRAMQVADMRQIMAQDPAGARQVLVGDFNAQPDAPELAPLWDTLTDAWDVAGDGAGLTYPAADPVKRIDYVTVSSGVTVTDVAVRETLAADHRPVVADLVIVRGR